METEGGEAKKLFALETISKLTACAAGSSGLHVADPGQVSCWYIVHRSTSKYAQTVEKLWRGSSGISLAGMAVFWNNFIVRGNWTAIFYVGGYVLP